MSAPLGTAGGEHANEVAGGAHLKVDLLAVVTPRGGEEDHQEDAEDEGGGHGNYAGREAGAAKSDHREVRGRVGQPRVCGSVRLTLGSSCSTRASISAERARCVREERGRRRKAELG